LNMKQGEGIEPPYIGCCRILFRRRFSLEKGRLQPIA